MSFDIKIHFLIDGAEEIGICGVCDIRIVKNRQIAVLQKRRHPIKIHGFYIFQKTLYRVDRLLALPEIKAGPCRGGQDKNDQENDQSFFLFLPFFSTGRGAV